MVPLSSDDITRHVPETLRNLPSPPTFLIRPATGRDKRRYEDCLIAEGLTYHDQDRVQAEVFRGLEANWSRDIYERESGRLRQTFENIQKDVATPEEVAEANDLLGRLRDCWPPYNRMLADNVAFLRDAPLVAMSLLLVGWEGIETPHERRAGMVPFDVLEKVAGDLQSIEEKAAESKIAGLGKPGTAWLEIANAALMALNLTETERKNSLSRSASESDRKTSTAHGTDNPAGESVGESGSGSGKSRRRPRKPSGQSPSA